MRVVLKKLTGESIEVDVDGTANFDDLRRAVSEKCAEPPQNLRIIFSGKELSGSGTSLSAARFTDGCICHLVIRKAQQTIAQTSETHPQSQPNAQPQPQPQPQPQSHSAPVIMVDPVTGAHIAFHPSMAMGHMQGHGHHQNGQGIIMAHGNPRLQYQAQQGVLPPGAHIINIQQVETVSIPEGADPQNLALAQSFSRSTRLFAIIDCILMVLFALDIRRWYFLFAGLLALFGYTGAKRYHRPYVSVYLGYLLAAAGFRLYLTISQDYDPVFRVLMALGVLVEIYIFVIVKRFSDILGRLSDQEREYLIVLDEQARHGGRRYYR